MGWLDDAVGNVLNRTKDNLSYRAGDAATGAVLGGINKGINKVKGEKDAPKTLEKCPKCKAKLEPDAKFCPECGYKLIVNCEKCSIEYQIGTKFCKKCGEALK